MLSSDQSGKTTTSLSQMGPFEDLFKQHYAFVCNVLYRYVGDKSKVEDLAQEIFIELWLKKDQILIHSSLGAYLRRMAVTRSLNYLRDSKKHNWENIDTLDLNLKDELSQQPEAIRLMEGDEMRIKLEEAIGKLPEKCRVIFMLSRFDELPYAEIARHLEISVKTVENQIGKALKYLRNALAESRG